MERTLSGLVGIPALLPEDQLDEVGLVQRVAGDQILQQIQVARMVEEDLGLDSLLPERVRRPLGVIEGGGQNDAGRLSPAPKGHGTRIEGP